jgi:heptosyltransferase-3
MKIKLFAIHIVRFFCRTKIFTRKLPDQLKSIVILAPERYGDLILLTPLLKHLNRRFPGICLTLAGVNDSVFFFLHDQHVHKLYNGKKMLYRPGSLLFKESYDMLYNPKDHPSFVFLLLTCRLKAERKVGIDHPLHRRFYHNLLPVEAGWSKLQINCALLSFLNIKPSREDQRPYLPHAAVSDRIKHFVEEKLPANTVVINLSASNWIRQWPLAHWQTVLDQFRQPLIIVAMPQQAKKKNF